MPDSLEAKPLPEFDRPDIGAYHKIELHGAKPAFLRQFKRMQAHRPRDSPPLRRFCCDVSAVRHMRSAAILICAQEVGAEDHSIFYANKGFFLRCKPERERW